MLCQCSVSLLLVHTQHIHGQTFCQKCAKTRLRATGPASAWSPAAKEKSPEKGVEPDSRERFSKSQPPELGQVGIEVSSGVECQS